MLEETIQNGRRKEGVWKVLEGREEGREEERKGCV